jgi:hypothetical protein
VVLPESDHVSDAQAGVTRHRDQRSEPNAVVLIWVVVLQNSSELVLCNWNDLLIHGRGRFQGQGGIAGDPARNVAEPEKAYATQCGGASNQD